MARLSVLFEVQRTLNEFDINNTILQIRNIIDVIRR